MKLFHASTQQFAVIKRQQATHPEQDAFVVPDSELQNKIYLTPNLGFAIAMAAGPDGMTSLIDGTISFEHVDAFDPDKVVFVYEVESDAIDPALIEHVDADQVAVDQDELVPYQTYKFQAKDVFDYYRLTDWKHPKN